jgi:type VI protein secretion system component VasF
MRLLELTEPLFLYICELNRGTRKGAHLEYGRARAEIEGLFKDMRTTAAGEIGLNAQFQEIEPVLIFFVDSIISDSDLEFAEDWNRNRMADERNLLAGDSRFWELLKDTLAESTEEATERLAVFHTCIGLGFVGDHIGEPEAIRNNMAQVTARLRGTIDMDDDTLSIEQRRICPAAYENVNTADLIEPPGVKLMGIAIALVGLIVVLFVANVWLFKETSRDLNNALDTVIAHDAASGAPAAKAADGQE